MRGKNAGAGVGYPCQFSSVGRVRIPLRDRIFLDVAGLPDYRYLPTIGGNLAKLDQARRSAMTRGKIVADFMRFYTPHESESEGVDIDDTGRAGFWVG